MGSSAQGNGREISAWPLRVSEAPSATRSRPKAAQGAKGTSGKADTSRDTSRLISEIVGTSGRIGDQKAADRRLERSLARRFRKLFKARKGKLGEKDLTAATEAEEQRARARAAAEQRAWRRRRSRSIDLLFFFNW